MKKNREKCVLCDFPITEELFQLKMPLFMGVVDDKQDYILGNLEEPISMTFTKCSHCYEIQIKECIDLNILYGSNHNIGVIGDVWKNHYIELSSFIAKGINAKDVLELSDPSAKIAKLSIDYNSWTIIEPNPEDIKIDGVEFIKGFFDDSFETDKNVDVIIHSHLLEHIHEPLKFIEKCSSLLKENGKMYISVPNMEYLLLNGHAPNNILHFEHTFYLNENIMYDLAFHGNFSITKSMKYLNHSIFYELTKNSPRISDRKGYKDDPTIGISDEFLISHIKQIELIKEINFLIKKRSKTHKIYIFGAHVSSQFKLFNGLFVNFIDGIIDNSKDKQGKRLYGTKLQVFDPEIIADEDCVVICSHTGVYFDEISEQLIKINNNVIIL